MNVEKKGPKGTGGSRAYVNRDDVCWPLLNNFTYNTRAELFSEITVRERQRQRCVSPGACEFRRCAGGTCCVVLIHIREWGV